MQFIKHFTKQNKKFLIIAGVLLTITVIVFPHAARAQFSINWEGAIITIVGFIVRMITSLLSMLLALFIDLLVKIAGFNHFIDKEAPPAVDIGWRLIRDLSNMMFIVILLIMAFGTIFKLQTYHAKNMLGKFIIMVFLVNFSKTICGFFIDFAQIVMMTFVNAFSDTASLTVAIGMQLDKFTSISDKSKLDVMGASQVLTAMLLSIVMLVVAMGVILAMMIILLFRVIMIWILVIFSPLAYICQLLPQTKKYASQWWQEFGKYLIVGPVMAFFLWLSLSIMVQMARSPISVANRGAMAPVYESATPKKVDNSGPEHEPYAPTSISTSQAMFDYIITIALLWAGLMMTQQMGVMGGSMVGKIQSSLSSAGAKVLRSPLKGGAMFARKFKAKTGVDLNPASIYRTMKAGFERKKVREEMEGSWKAGTLMENKGGVLGALGGLGAPGWVDNYAQGAFYWKGVTRALPGGTGKRWLDKREKNIAQKRKEAEEAKRLTNIENPEDLVEGELNKELKEREDEKKAIEAELKLNFDQQKIKDDMQKIQAYLKDPKNWVALKDPLAKEEDKDKALAKKGKLEDHLQELQNKEKYRTSVKGKDHEKGLGDRFKELDENESNKKSIAYSIKQALDFSASSDKQQFAQSYLKDRMTERATRRKKVDSAIKNSSLTKEQQDARTKRKDQIDIIEIPDINVMINDARAKGEDTSGLTKRLYELEREKKELDASKKPTKDEIEENNNLAQNLDEEQKKDKGLTEILNIDPNKREAFREQKLKEAEELDKVAEDMQKGFEKWAAWRPRDIEAQVMRRHMINERAKSIDTENGGELVAYMKSATRRKDTMEMAAIAQQAARVGNLNALVNNTRALKDYYYDKDTDTFNDKGKGQKIIAEGSYFDSDAMGLHGWIRDMFIKQLGLNEQAALALESDLSTIAQGNDQWTFAQAIKTDPAGRFVQRGYKEWNNFVYNERSKKPQDALWQRGNRLSIASEGWRDGDPKKGYKSKIHPYAAMEIMLNWPQFEALASRGRFNKNAAEHLFRDNRSFLDEVRKAVPSSQIQDWHRLMSRLEALGKSALSTKSIGAQLDEMEMLLKKIGIS